ncbi:MAG: hypothetical protein KFF73_01690 [Cyclobacteriaceae bacterium]|nr:hypothetical protein [Cyclobacteriaceae bacterium]
MRSRVFLIICLLILIDLPQLQAQFERTAGKIVADKKPGGIIETYNLEKSDAVEGSIFINDAWYIGDVTLKDERRLEKVPLKYNLRDDLLHILDSNNVTRVIESDRINHFEWFNFKDKKNNLFVNALRYRIDEVPLTGMAEILVDGEACLLIYRKLKIQEAMYSVIHDAGQKNDEFVIHEIHYIGLGHKLFRIRSKKSLRGLFPGQEEAMESFIRVNHFNVKNADHLGLIVRQYNSLQRH